MHTVNTATGPVRFCVLIPSRQRVDLLAKSLRKMPWLNDEDTIVGFESGEAQEYAAMLHGGDWRRVSPAIYKNPTGSVAVAREYLRYAAIEMRKGKYAYYVVTDDNAVHVSHNALLNLVRAAHEWWYKPVIMAGMHNTAIHFDRGKLGRKETVNGLTSYPAVAMMFQVYDHALYSQYQYPANAYGLDDRHLCLWAMSQGVRDFRVCMDAPFTKSRYQKGGQGTIDERMVKCGKAIAQLATDFPRYVGAVGTLRIPWEFLLKMESGATADRLVGGAMRSAIKIARHKPL